MRRHGVPVPVDALVASDLVLPAKDAGPEEVRSLLAGEGLIPDERRTTPCPARSVGAPKRPGLQAGAVSPWRRADGEAGREHRKRHSLECH